MQVRQLSLLLLRSMERTVMKAVLECFRWVQDHLMSLHSKAAISNADAML